MPGRFGSYSSRPCHHPLVAVLLGLAAAHCAVAPEPYPESKQGTACVDPAQTADGPSPLAPVCDNGALTGYDELLVLAPHPDDETLAFAGLIASYLDQGKPVRVAIVTDGDAYCDACRFWKTSSTTGPTCGAADLSNFATAEVDSFGEVRRAESAAALDILGAGAPIFLGYPDTGLAASWTNFEAGAPSKALRRADFSACDSCETCDGGYGEGPETELSASTLMANVTELMTQGADATLIATTHWLDGHGDHAGLGRFVRHLNAQLDVPRPVAYGVIHANTPKDTPHSDCWYPEPRALACPCAEQECASADPDWLGALRAHRYRPAWPAALPDDADYGDATQLCLPESMWRGDLAIKRAAIDAYASQLGFATREGALAPELGGLMDCNGYLISFVKSTEAFVLETPALAALDDRPSRAVRSSVWNGRETPVRAGRRPRAEGPRQGSGPDFDH